MPPRERREDTDTFRNGDAELGACQRVFEMTELLLQVCAFLPPRALAAFLLVNRSSAALAAPDDDRLWRFVAASHGVRSAERGHCMSWRQALQLLRRDAVVRRVRMPISLPVSVSEKASVSAASREREFAPSMLPPLDVTALCHSRTHRFLGTSDGCVHLLPLGSAVGSRMATVRLVGAGSVRHVQVEIEAGIGERVYVGTWAGAVFAVDLDTRTGADLAGSGSSAAVARCLVSGVAGPVYALCASRARLICGSGDGRIGVYDGSGGPPRAVWRAHDGAVTDVCLVPRQGTAGEAPPLPHFDRDATAMPRSSSLQQELLPSPLLASASYDGTVRVWSLSGALEATLRGHRGPVWSVVFDEGTRTLLSASSDGTVCAWRELPAAAATVGGDSAAHSAPAAYVAAGAPPPLAAIPRQWYRAWLRSTTAPSNSRHRQIFCLKVSGDGVLAGGSDGAIFCLCVRSGELLWSAGVSSQLDKRCEDGVRRLDVIGGTILAATQHGDVSLFDLVPQSALASFSRRSSC